MEEIIKNIAPALTILGLAFTQNVSFTLVSRSRNRSHMRYHLIASVFSNGIWFLTFRELVLAKMTFMLFIPYTVGTVAGSLFGAAVSMKIEAWLGATSDEHVKKSDPELEALKKRVAVLETNNSHYGLGSKPKEAPLTA